ncbi:hypothetical protein, partial [Streptomyces sp. NPDC001274]
MPDPNHDTLADRLRLIGTQMPAPALPAAEIRRRADRRRHRRHVVAATVACTAAALCLAIPSVLHSSGQRRGAASGDVPSTPDSPRPAASFSVTSTTTTPIDAGTVAGIL